MTQFRASRRTEIGLSILLLTSGVAHLAHAGQDANFVVYNQHLEEKGATEVKVYSDYGRVGNGDPNYIAQLFEIEHGVTDLYTTAIYLEAAKTLEGVEYDFASFRWENRYRLFKEDTLLNPVLYVEYEYKKPDSVFVRSVVGRTDGEEEEVEGQEKSEHELETKLILGRDLTSRLNVAVNTIQEVNLVNGVWAFGYAGGLNYALYRSLDDDSVFEAAGSTIDGRLNKLTLGVEFFGGLGDSIKGVTFDPDKTEQYVGVGLRADFKNDLHFGIGGAFGLTKESQDAVVRVTAGFEFE